jgi:hypothetical protein
MIFDSCDRQTCAGRSGGDLVGCPSATSQHHEGSVIRQMALDLDHGLLLAAGDQHHHHRTAPMPRSKSDAGDSASMSVMTAPD